MPTTEPVDTRTAAPPRDASRGGAGASRFALVAALGIAAVVAGVALLTGAVPVGAAAAGPPQVGQEFPVTSLHLARGFASNTPTIVADPTNPDFVVIANRLDAPDFGCALQVSGDGGRTWQPANPISEVPEGADKCYAGQAAFDRDGTLYYLFVGLREPGNQPMGTFITTSEDRARTFSAPREVLGEFNYSVRLAIDRTRGDSGRIHLVWVHAPEGPATGGFRAPPNPIRAAHSDDGGATFSEPVQVSDPARQRVAGPALALGPDGTSYVAYYDLEDDRRDYRGLEGPTWDGTWSLVVTASPDGGGTFGAGVAVDDGIVPHERVMLIFTMPPPALAAGDGRLCTAWTDARAGDADALLRCSADGGRTFGGLRRLNDDPAGNGRSQYQPALGLAPDGRIDAVFYDRRTDPEDLRNHVSYTYSTDGGATFAPNLTLTTQRSHTLIGQRYAIRSAQGLVEFGSKMGLLSRADGAVAAWTDTRNSRGGTSQVLFSTTVAFPQPSQPGWARAVGAALVVAGVVAGLVAVRRMGRRTAAEGGGRP